MTDTSQVRINELARELEVKAKAIIDLLPGYGVTEKKTHSSSIPADVAVKVREHLQGAANAEAAAEATAKAEKQAKEAAAKAARMRPAAAPAASAPAAPAVQSPVSVAPAPTAPGSVATAPAAASPVSVPSTSAPSTVAHAPKPAAPVAPAGPTVPTGTTRRPAPAAGSSARPVPAGPSQRSHPTTSHLGTQVSAQPGSQSGGQPGTGRPSGQAGATRPAAAGPAAGSSAGTSGATARSTAPAAKPGVAARSPLPTGNRGPLPGCTHGASRPLGQGGQRAGGSAGPRPGQPIRPQQPSQGRTFTPRPGGRARLAGAPSRPFEQRRGAMPMGTRPGPRAPGRPGMLPPFPEKLPPKAEPGKPLYTRKPPQRQRPVIDKREAEGERKLHPTRQRPGASDRRSAAALIAPPEPRAPRELTITEGITIRELAEKLDVRAKELLKNLLDRGVFASINQALDIATATTLAESFSGVVSVVSLEEEMVLEVAKEETKESLKPRPPVVTVMGHVDHGKTSLLDAIRSEDVAAGEAGGITQHIGAYKVQVNNRSVVFIDTPGHEAFTRMRARGAKVTDIVVLVVAADDGVMPQTKEAIDHAKAANVSIVVAINKIDKPEAQPERVKRQLADNGLLPAEWGGDTEFVEVSAKQKTGIEKLLETLLLVAELREF